jgi:hypothetical protein
MSCFEGWLKLDPAIGPRTMAYVTKFISRTLEKTHNLKDVRYEDPASCSDSHPNTPAGKRYPRASRSGSGSPGTLPPLFLA